MFLNVKRWIVKHFYTKLISKFLNTLDETQLKNIFLKLDGKCTKEMQKAKKKKIDIIINAVVVIL